MKQKLLICIVDLKIYYIWGSCFEWNLSSLFIYPKGQLYWGPRVLFPLINNFKYSLTIYILLDNSLKIYYWTWDETIEERKELFRQKKASTKFAYLFLNRIWLCCIKPDLCDDGY